MGSRDEHLEALVKDLVRRADECPQHQPLRGVLGDYYCALCDLPLTEEEVEES